MATQQDLGMPGFDDLATAVRRAAGLDLRAYRAPQLGRRLTSFLLRQGLPGLEELAGELNRRPALVQEFIDVLGINVTEFLRNRHLFERLEELLGEMTAAGHAPRKVWSAGCAVGCEPYTLAMVLGRLDPAGAWEILATDIDSEALAAARAGVYQAHHLRSLRPEEVARWFRRVEEGWQLDERLARRVVFARHDLLRDSYPTGQDVILCRNVTIYFEADVKTRVMEKMALALAPGGLLFLGGSEGIFDTRALGLEMVSPFFYRRLSGDPS